MRLSKFTWFLTALIAIIYTATLIVIRIENPHHIQAESYRCWREAYIIKQSANRAFVNTSNNRAKPVALSEGQGARRLTPLLVILTMTTLLTTIQMIQKMKIWTLMTTTIMKVIR